MYTYTGSGYRRGYCSHVKRGRQTLRLLNGLRLQKHIEGQTVDYINIESKTQKSSPIILLVLFHSACPFKLEVLLKVLHRAPNIIYLLGYSI